MAAGELLRRIGGIPMGGSFGAHVAKLRSAWCCKKLVRILQSQGQFDTTVVLCNGLMTGAISPCNSFVIN